MTGYTPGPSRLARLRAWLTEPAPGTESGRRLAAARARQAEQDRRRARLEAVRARYADQARHEECRRVQASWACAPRPERPADIPADIPAVPDHVPGYLVELTRAPDGSYGRP